MEDQEQLMKIAKSAGIVFIGLVLSKLLGYAYRIMIARGLGSVDYGLLALGLAVVGIVQTISLLGLNSGVVRYVSYYKGKKDARRIKGTILTAVIISGLLSIVFGALLYFLSNFISVSIFHNSNLIIVLKILAFIIPIAVLNNVLLAGLRAFQNIKYFIYAQQIAGGISNLVIAAIFLLLGFGLVGITIAYNLSLVCVLIFAFYFLKKTFPFLSRSIKALGSVREIVSYSWPLLLSFFLYAIITWTDSLMLGYFKTAREVGIYNVALPTSGLMLIVGTALIVLFMPVIVEMIAKNKDVKHIFRATTRWIFFVNFPLLLLMILFSRQIIFYFFGQQYIEGATPLTILSIGYFIYALFLTSGEVLKALKRTKIIMINNLIVAILNIILNLILIPRYGMIGGATATTISLTTYGILNSMRIKYKIGFSLDYFKLILIGLFSVFVIKILNKFIFVSDNLINAFLMGIIFVLIYGLLLILFKCLKKEDKIILNRIKRKLNLTKGL